MRPTDWSEWNRQTDELAWIRRKGLHSELHIHHNSRALLVFLLEELTGPVGVPCVMQTEKFFKTLMIQKWENGIDFFWCFIGSRMDNFSRAWQGLQPEFIWQYDSE